MITPSKIYVSLAILVLTFGLGFYSGWRFAASKPEQQTQISSQLILTALHDRGFLVTQTYVFDEPVTIKKTTGSAFQDFFFGQTVTARGTMEVNLGVDLASLTDKDVAVADNHVTITLPKAKLFNTSLVGPIDVKNEQGLLKRVLNSDDGYNQALAELTRASEAVAQKPELLASANDRAKDEVGHLLQYVAKDATVTVEGKN